MKKMYEAPEMKEMPFSASVVLYESIGGSIIEGEIILMGEENN